MLDLESLAKTSNSKIIQIGAIIFDPWGGDEDGIGGRLDFKRNIKKQFQQGYTDPDTVDWWRRQKKAHPQLDQSLSIPDPINIRQAILDYYEFISGCTYEWSNGPEFDAVILRWNADKLGLDSGPVGYWNYCQTRIIYNLGDPNREYFAKAKEVISGDAHDALVDCERQIYRLQQCYKKLFGSKDEYEARVN